MNSKKKITFIIYSLNAGGAERVICTLANFLAKKHEVEILVYSNSPSFYFISPRVNIKIIRCKKATKFPLKSLRSSFFRIMALKKNFTTSKSDVYISFTTVMNLYSIIAKLFSKTRLVISERNDPRHRKIGIFKTQLRNLLYPFSDKLVVQNNAQYEYYKGKINKNKLTVINNPIGEVSPFISKDDKVHIVNIGRLVDQKNQIELINIFISANLDCNLYIIGDGPNKSKIQDYINETKMDDRIHLLGLQKDISKYLNPNWIFVSTSVFEGYPNALLEAMNAGLSCIHYDCPSGIGEILDNEVNGYLIPMNQNKIFSSKLKELFNDKAKRTLFGANARKSVQRLQVENIVDKWLEIL